MIHFVAALLGVACAPLSYLSAFLAVLVMWHSAHAMAPFHHWERGYRKTVRNHTIFCWYWRDTWVAGTFAFCLIVNCAVRAIMQKPILTFVGYGLMLGFAVAHWLLRTYADFLVEQEPPFWKEREHLAEKATAWK